MKIDDDVVAAAVRLFTVLRLMADAVVATALIVLETMRGPSEATGDVTALIVRAMTLEKLAIVVADAVTVF